MSQAELRLPLSERPESLDQDFRIASALLIARAAGGGEVVRGAFRESALGLEVGEGLRREGEQRVQSELAGARLDILDQLSSDPLVLVRGVDVEAGELALVALRVDVQRDASDRVAIDLEQEVVADPLLDLGRLECREAWGLGWTRAGRPFRSMGEGHTPAANKYARRQTFVVE